MIFITGIAVFLLNILLINGAKHGVLPTREQQANLLLNVEEIFQEIKSAVEEEAQRDDVALAEDVDKMVKRSQDKLYLVLEMSLINIGCKGAQKGCPDKKEEIEQEVKKSIEHLEECTANASAKARANSDELYKTTAKGTDKGQSFLDFMYSCSKSPVLEMLPCYKRVIAEEVLPTKTTLIDAIRGHKNAHFNSIAIRSEANECVDKISQNCQIKVATLLTEALSCNGS